MKNQSRQPLSFMEALEAELRKEIRAEFAACDSATPSPEASAYERLELWLSARISRKQTGTPRSSAFGNYQQQAKIKSEHVGSMENPATQNVSQAVAEAVLAAKAFATSSNVKPSHELDVMDIAALEFFRRNGVCLSESFDETELKSAYRKLALKFHPDRHAGATTGERSKFADLFSQATEQTKRLSRHLIIDSKLAA